MSPAQPFLIPKLSVSSKVGIPSTEANPNQLDFYIFSDGLVSDVSGSGGLGMLRSRNDKNSNGCRCHISIPNSSAFIYRPPLVWRSISDSSFTPSINLSGNINPLVTPPPSSRYGPESSKTKHPKSWAATLSAKRPRQAIRLRYCIL